MAKASKKQKVKKKGPRGKKARAKAKLERQWGEQAKPGSESERRGLHSSKTRALEEQQDVSQDLPQEPAVQEDDSDLEDDQAYSSLLQSIREKTGRLSSNRSNNADFHNENDDSLDQDDSVDRNTSTDDESEAEMDDTEPINLAVDPFTHRFASSSSNDESEKPSDALNKLDLSKYNIPHRDEHVQVQASQWLLDTLIESTNSTSSTFDWSQLARAYFDNMRPGLQTKWESLVRPTTAKHALLNHTQRLLFPPLACYADILWTLPDHKTRQSTHQVILLHILNHVLTSRSRISSHDRRLQKINNDSEMDATNSDLFRDQGFTRPTVLILLPTRGVCYTFIQQLLHLLGDSPDNLDRFEQEYGPPPRQDDMDNAQQQRRRNVLQQKGTEWNELFGDHVNDDDDFRLGLSLHPGKKQHTDVKLFSDFYKSDIIVASPLGLKMTATQGDDHQVDYLSSIEICCVLQSDVLLMQNWDHVSDVLSWLNQQPKNTNDTDFSRVRPYILDGQAAQYRQLIISAQFLDPLLISAFKRHAKSRSGQVRIRRRVPPQQASITRVLFPTSQVFQRINASSFASQGQDRLEYFCNTVLPHLTQKMHTLIYIPSYFEYVSLRNVLIKRELDFCSVTEYSRVSETSRGRARFLQGHKPFMLYTGRAHFFHRHVIKGARHIIFMGLPEHAEFYTHHVNLLHQEGLDHAVTDSASMTSCLVLFTKYESHALERIVGSSNCRRMVNGDKSTFMFSA